MTARAFWTIASMVACLSSCQSRIDEVRRDVQKAVVAHFDAIKRGSYDDVLAGYSEQFFAQTPREEARARLKEVNERLGALVSYRVVSWNLHEQIGVDGGTYVDVTCEVRYSKSLAAERLRLFRKHGATRFGILGHNYSPSGLPKPTSPN